MKRKKHKSIYFLIFVLLLLSGIVFFQISEAYTKTLSKEQELESLNNELVRELERKVELEEMEYYIQSDEFIIKKARNEFNLIQEGEILFITEE